MSATLDLKLLSKRLNAPVLSSEGRQYPVEVEYVPCQASPTIEEVAKVVINATERHQASILVFLTGVGEIKQLQERLQDRVDESFDICPLFGGLTMEQQTQAIRPAAKGRFKIVLATNIAQTSLTIEGIHVVVDSGMEKVLVYQFKSAMEQLVKQPISQAASIQRAGRAGRLGPGVCYRLGSKEQFERRRQQDVAEIERVDLSQLLLEVKSWGADFDDLFWLSQPEPSLLNAAQNKLIQLGYWQINGQQKLVATDLVEQFLQLGLDLRLCKMLVAARGLETNGSGILATACFLATFIQEAPRSHQFSDLSELLEQLPSHLWHALQSPLKKLASKLKIPVPKRSDIDCDWCGLLLALAYPDRLAAKRGKQWKLSSGVGCQFHASQVEPKHELIVVADVNASEYGQYVNLYAPVPEQVLRTHYSELFLEQKINRWSAKGDKPERVQLSAIGQLVLSETRLPTQLSDDEWCDLWVTYIQGNGVSCLGVQAPAFSTLQAKLDLLCRLFPEQEWPLLDKHNIVDTLLECLPPYLTQIRTTNGLKQLDLSDIMLSSLDWPSQQKLQSYCPDSYTTPAGNSRKISYRADEAVLSVKLQEMFGEPTSPTICEGRFVLTLELLSPAQRPLQVTRDLSSFWQNAYQDVKKEMKGRYPKHPWPDDPVSFVATSKTKAQLARK